MAGTSARSRGNVYHTYSVTRASSLSPRNLWLLSDLNGLKMGLDAKCLLSLYALRQSQEP